MSNLAHACNDEYTKVNGIMIKINFMTIWDNRWIERCILCSVAGTFTILAKDTLIF